MSKTEIDSASREPLEALEAGGQRPVPRPRGRRTGLRTVLGRALRLRCPVCGLGPMFAGALKMHDRCSHCGLWFERASGYFLGSIYVNYAATATAVAALYLIPMLILGAAPKALIAPVVAFCVIFPVFFFRYARSIWLAGDHYLNCIDPADVPRHAR